MYLSNLVLIFSFFIPAELQTLAVMASNYLVNYSIVLGFLLFYGIIPF